MLIILLLFEVSMRDHKSYRLSGCWAALFLLWSCIQLVKTFSKTAIQEITTSWVVDPSLCATDIRQKWCVFSSQVNVEMQCSLSPPAGDSITEDLSVQCDTLALCGVPSFIKASLPLVLSICSCVLLPPGPKPLQGWERRLRLSFCLAISSFEKTRERTKDYWPTHLHLPQPWDRSVHPNIHPCDKVSGHTSIPSTHGHNQAASQTLLVRQQSSTPTLSRGLSLIVRVPLSH